MSNSENIKLKALLHSSGQSAMTTMFMSNLVAGDMVLASNSLYGGTFEFLNHFIPAFGVKPCLQISEYSRGGGYS